jgi:hypothetical protein
MKKARIAAVGLAAAFATISATSLLSSAGASAQAARPAKHFMAPTVPRQANRGALLAPSASPAAASALRTGLVSMRTSPRSA